MRDLARRLARVDFYVRSSVCQALPGRRRSRFRGAGLELDKITAYELGDDPRWINWSATARTGGTRVLKNSLIEERQLQVVLAVDLSGSMEFGTMRASKREVAAEVAAVIAHVAWRMGDAVGFVGYTSRVERAWPPRRSPRDRFLIPAIILGLRAGGRADGTAVLAHLPRTRSLVFVLSDFQDDPAVLGPAVIAAARRHDVVPVIIEDPRERSLPGGSALVRVRDLETGAHRSIWLGRSSGEAWRRRLERREADLATLFWRAGVEPLRVDPTRDPLLEIATFFLRRRARARCGAG